MPISTHARKAAEAILGPLAPCEVAWQANIDRVAGIIQEAIEAAESERNAPIEIEGFNGEWYAFSRRGPREPVYIHQDGKWRSSTADNGVYTGYFPTQGAVLAALKVAGEEVPE